MERAVIQEIKRAGLEENHSELLRLAQLFPNELHHAAIEHEVGKIIYQDDDS